ncbi:MAG: hypothetical protein AB7V50_09010 [Vampirovibrionia bacterium]
MKLILNILILFLFIIFIPGCNQKEIQSVVNEEKDFYTPEEEQCISKLAVSEIGELMDTFLIKDGDKYKKKNPESNVCKEYLNFKEKTSPIIKEQMPDMSFARGEYQETIKLPNDDVLIIGGNEGEIKTVELFDIKKKKFQIITDNFNKYINSNISVLKTPFYINDNNIYYQGAVYDINKKQFINNKTETIKKIDNFDSKIASKKWQNKTKLTFYKLFDNGTALFIKEYDDHNGSKGLLLIDLLGKNQYLPAYFKQNKNYFYAFLYKNNSVLIIGGYSFGSADQLIVHNNVEIYNPITGKITLLGKLDSDYNLDPHFTYPYGLNPHKNSCKPLYFKNDIVLLSGYTEDTMYLYYYDLNLKKIIKKNQSTYCHLIYPIGKDKLLFVPEQYFTNKNMFSSEIIKVDEYCKRRYAAYLFDLNKQENSKKLYYTDILYPYQRLTPLGNGFILMTGGIRCQIKEPGIPYSKEAYVLKLK